jgi:hypothetical protein
MIYIYPEESISKVTLKKLIDKLKGTMTTGDQLSSLHYEFEALKQENLKDTLEYFKNEGIDITELVDATLDLKYRYPNPLEKAKTIQMIGVDEKEWFVKDVDTPNLERGIGADCGSNSRHLFKSMKTFREQHPEISLQLTEGRGNSYFSNPGDIHIFLMLTHHKKSFIFDPSLKWIGHLETS